MVTWQRPTLYQPSPPVTATTTTSSADYGSNAAQQDTMRGIVDGTGPDWQREPTPTGWGNGGSQSVLREGPETEMDRQLRWQNGNAMAWQQQSQAVGPVAANLPQPASSDLLGTVEYYDFRARDFSRRHPGAEVPDYYLGYGRKYCFRFSEVLFPQLSDAGKRWCISTRMNLQLAIEQRLLNGPAAFDTLEVKPGALRAYAFDTHPDAYLDAGLADLPIADLVAISLTPDMEDLATLAGAIQAAKAGAGVAEDWAGDVVEGVTDAVDQVGAWWEDLDDPTAEVAA